MKRTNKQLRKELAKKFSVNDPWELYDKAMYEYEKALNSNRKELPELNTDIPDAFNTPEFEEALEAFKEMRKKNRKPMTPYAEKLILKKLFKAESVDHAIVMLNKSTVKNYTDVYDITTSDFETYGSGKKDARQIEKTGFGEL